MAVTLTYDAALGRVRITANGLGTAVTALVQRSTDQVSWTTVRGAADVAVTGGAFTLTLDDYEWSPNVINYYRVAYPAGITFVAAGAAAAADNANLTPGAPAGLAVGHTLLYKAAIRGHGAITDLPAPWKRLVTGPFFKVFGRVHDGSAIPTVAFTGGVAGDTTQAQVAAFTNVGDLATVLTAGVLTNASAQNIATPALDVVKPNGVALVGGHKLDDWTGVAPGPAAGFVEIGDPSSVLGSDQGIAWDYQIQTATTDVPAGSLVVTGGGAAVSYGWTAWLPPATLTQTANITPTIAPGLVWLKDPQRPFLNRLVPWKSYAPIVRPSRSGVHDVQGRSLPVVIGEVRGSRRFTLRVVTSTYSEERDLDLLLAAGGLLFVQSAPNCGGPPTLYVDVGDVEYAPAPTDAVSGPVLARRIFTLPLTEGAAPGPDVVGSTATWQTVLNLYPTWADVLAANPTWADVLALVGSPSEVIVP